LADNELWLADAIDRLAARSSVVAQPIEGWWMPADDPLHQIPNTLILKGHS
jgi:hypothetical protein